MSIAWPGAGEPGAEERRDRVVGARHDRQVRRKTELGRRRRPEPADDGARPGRGRSDALVEPGGARLRRGDRLGRILERRGGHAGQAEGDVVPGGQEPGGVRRRPRAGALASSSARPRRPTTQPPRPIAAPAAAVSWPARRSSHVIAGARARPSAAVATSVGPWPTTQMAIGSTGPSTVACARAMPIPRTRAVHQASGRPAPRGPARRRGAAGTGPGRSPGGARPGTRRPP